MKTPLVTLITLLALPISQAHAIDTTVPSDRASDPEPWIAEYEGEEVDLRFGWDGARACQTDGIETICYDTEAEMLAALGGDAAVTAPVSGTGFRRASCGSYLRLYTGSNYSGSVLALTSQYVYLNLSNYGFNNVTSSYRVGGCSSYFFDLSSGGPPQYGGATWAWAESASMNAGWDNRVSSIYIG